MLLNTVAHESSRVGNSVLPRACNEHGVLGSGYLPLLIHAQITEGAIDGSI